MPSVATLYGLQAFFLTALFLVLTFVFWLSSPPLNWRQIPAFQQALKDVSPSRLAVMHICTVVYGVLTLVFGAFAGVFAFFPPPSSMAPANEGDVQSAVFNLTILIAILVAGMVGLFVRFHLSRRRLAKKALMPSAAATEAPRDEAPQSAI